MITDKHSTNSQSRVFCGIVLMVLFSFTPLRAQGVLYDPVADDTLPQLPLYGGTKGNSALPTTYSLRDYCPTPSNQHATNACVSFASGYGALSIHYAKRNGWTKATVSQNAFSAAYVFKTMNKGGGFTTVPAVFKFMTDNGVCRVNTFPNSLITEPIKQTLILKAQKEAEQNKNFGLAVQSSGKTAAKIKETLAMGFPVIFIADIDTPFKSFKKDVWQPLPKEDKKDGQHAMLIVGYDDKYFDVMNSYGTGWGKEGFIKLKQSDIDAVIKFAYIIAPASKGVGVEDLTTTTIIDPELKEDVGLFTLKNFDSMVKNAVGLDSPKFVKTAIAYNEDRQLYETKPKSWRKTMGFKLFAENIPAGKYLYIFSLDPRNELTVHWPPDGRWAETDVRTSAAYAHGLVGKVVSAYILSDQILLKIPSPDEFLQANSVGEEQLIALVADQPIKDFRQRLDRFKLAHGVANERLQRVFGDILIPRHRLSPVYNGLSVSRFIYEPRGWVVPIVLSVEID